MNIVVNDINLEVQSATVEASLDNLTRQFTMTLTESQGGFKLGDSVEVYDSGGELLIKSEIEFISAENNLFTYAGRNATRLLVDSYANETIQFTTGSQLESVFSNIASKFDISVLGTAKAPVEQIKTILIGDNYGEALMALAKSSGQFIYSNGLGDLVIEDSASLGDLVFRYGQNIRSRVFVNDATQLYSRYVVVSQSNYNVNQSQDVQVVGEFGTGEPSKVFLSQDNLTAPECTAQAGIEYYRDARRSINYQGILDSSTPVELNTKYQIIDTSVGVDLELKATRLVYNLSESEDSLVATFEMTNE